MVRTFLLTLFLFSLLNVFRWLFLFVTLLFAFRCVVLLGFFCVMIADFSILQHRYCYSFCSKGKRHLQSSMSMTGNTSSFILIFANTGFLFPLCSFAFAVRTCLAPWTVLISYIFNPISHLHVIFHASLTILPAVDVQHPAPLNPRWLCFFPTIPVATLGNSSSFPL